jgi:fused signal recognition particle receptor
MFKFLKKALFGAEKELEKTLESQIEEELAKARAKPAAPPTPPPSAPPGRTVAPAAAPVAAPPPVAPPSPPAPEGRPEAPPVSKETVPPPPERMVPPPPPHKERASPPVSPAVAVPPTAAPAGYKEAKRLGALEEQQRKKETIEERLERELGQAVQTQKAIERVVGDESDRVVLAPDKLEDLLWELEVGLLEADVALPVIEAIKTSVREQLTVTGVQRRKAGQIVEEVLKTAIRQVLATGKLDFDAFIESKLKEKRPVVVMFVGVNGTGKTTSIAKLAHRFRQKGISCVLAAGDTFRAGAIEQLSLHGDRLGVKVIKHSAGSDPAAVAYDAIEHAKSRHKDVVLLDTAGRMQTNTNLMEEMAKIRRVARPDLTIFVGDSLAGNDAVEQARSFNKVVGIDGVILTKVDADAKGGAALSVAYTIGKPLLFIGVGQEYEQQIPFDADWMVERLFGEGGEEAEVEA